MRSSEKPSDGPIHATPEELAALRQLVAFGKDRVAGYFRADSEPDFRVLVVAFSSRVTTTLEALIELVEKGFGQQAMMMNRAAFELMLDCYWIDSNRELAVERFLQHARFERHLDLEVAGRYPEHFEGVPDEQLEEGELNELIGLYGRFGNGSWTGRNLHQRVEDVVGGFEDDFDRAQLRSFRDVVHRLQNQELHPTPLSVRRVLRRRSIGGGEEVFQYRVGPEPELGILALRSAWWVYLQTLHLLIGIFDMPLAEELDGFKDAASWQPWI